MVFEGYIPELHRVFQRDKQGLFPGNASIVTLIGTIGKALPTDVSGFIQILTHRLPRQAPVFPGVIIPDIDIMPGSIHRHPIRPKPGNPMVFRGFIEKITSRSMVKHPAEVPYPNIIRPGYGHINPVYHILPMFRIKITITHRLLLLLLTYFKGIVKSRSAASSLNKRFSTNGYGGAGSGTIPKVSYKNRVFFTPLSCCFCIFSQKYH
jgi:hypothetical protein